MGLAEAINEGLYLVPQMRRQQFQQAILGPLESADGSVTSALLDRMLNDPDNKSDQLPVLQHALLRLWDRAHASEPFDTAGYEAVGTFQNCLSAHAEEVYAELTESGKRVAKQLFSAITQVNKDRKMRRPRPVSEIVAATGASFGEVEAVIVAFSKPGRSFLVTTQGARSPRPPLSISRTSAPPPVVVTAPTIEAIVSQERINRGQSVTLSWKSQNANEVVIENMGTMPSNGSIVVRPFASARFQLVAKSDGGTAATMAIVEVVQPTAATPTPVTDPEPAEIKPHSPATRKPTRAKAWTTCRRPGLPSPRRSRRT